MLTLHDLVVHRGNTPVLHGINIEVSPGAITALLGANGAGKSTCVMAVAGVLPLTRGRILLDSVPLPDRRPDAVRAAGIAIVPEGHRVLGGLSVRDNLLAAATRLRREQLPQALARVLAIFPELEPRLEAAARTLSGGQKQMVCIAQALIVPPRHLIVDELSLGLSPLVVQRLAQVLREVADRGSGVLLIEQFTTLALELASQVHVLERGRLVFSGGPGALRERPEILQGSYLGVA